MTVERLREYYLDQPQEVSLETLARCNAACSFCPYPTLDRIGAKMPDALIYRLVDEMSDWQVPFGFSPFKVSEPLLDNRLYDILKRVNKTKAITRIFTNGAALTFKKAEQLANIDRLEMFISLHCVTKEAYEPLMGMSFDRTIANIDMLHDTDFPHPVTILKVGGTREEREQFLEYVYRRWPYYSPILVKQDGWLGYVNPENPLVPETPCARWFELSIMATGVVSLCCMDGTGKYAIGDVNKQTMLEVYNAPHWRERRELMLNRKQVPVCNQCTYGAIT